MGCAGAYHSASPASISTTAANFSTIHCLATAGPKASRSRALGRITKNDQAWVDQKNGSVVRRFVGYHRLEGSRAVEALARLYSATRLFVNFFQPSFKLKEKIRTGSRILKRYHAPETPTSRLLASNAVSSDVNPGGQVKLLHSWPGQNPPPLRRGDR